MPADRFLNLTQHFIVSRLDEDGRKQFLDALDRAERVEQLPGNEAPRRRRTPSWWRGDAAAVQSSLQAARQLGVAPVPEAASS